MSIAIFLQKLDKAKKTGLRKWQACCPAHEDKFPSLAITETDDGRILIYCFAGCEAEQIVSAVGLTTNDLFPHKPMQGHSKKPVVNPWSASDVLRGLGLEALVIYNCGRHLEKGEPLPPVDQARLRDAVSRFLGGIDVCNRA